MEQLKNSLGPFELFAAIIGGSPFILAGFLIYNPVDSLADLANVVQTLGDGGGALAISLTILFLSYVIGGAIQGLSWLYFSRLCKLFKKDYHSLTRQIRDRFHVLQHGSPVQPHSLEFEDRLALQVHEKLGIPKNFGWLDSRLKVYLREHNSPSVAVAETMVASHIMYRNLSLGCLLLSVVSLLNTIRLGALEPLLIVPLMAYLAYLMFLRAVSFKKWQNRELLLGFYFAVTKETESDADH
ncbi:MAG: hypothetical protein AAGA83_02260 [Cyanobacteria bacterium P01_F01_bin.116]